MPEQQQPAPGWYPNPSGAKGKLWWTGTEWTQGPPPKVTQPISLRKILLICGALLAIVLVISLFQGEDKEAETASSSTSTTAPVFIPKPSSSVVASPPPPAAPAPAAPAPGVACSPAQPDLVAQIEGHLGNGLTLQDTFQVDSADSGYLYVGGNIMEGETKVSSSDVWLAQDGFVIYALSGTAREMTPLADGRDLGLSAGDEFGQAVQECVQVAERARNSGGN